MLVMEYADWAEKGSVISYYSEANLSVERWNMGMVRFCLSVEYYFIDCHYHMGCVDKYIEMAYFRLCSIGCYPLNNILW